MRIAFAVVYVFATASLAHGQFATPEANDGWAVGSKHVVRWDAKSIPAGRPAKLAFSVDAGKTWMEIATVAGSGEAVWKVNAAVGPCRLRVQSDKDSVQSADFRVIPSQEVAYAWTSVNKKAAFAPRDGAGALTYAGKMWFLGGWNPGDRKIFPRICNNEVWSSKDGLTWTLDKANTFKDTSFKPDLDWEGRHTAGYVVYRDKMWIVGGDCNQGHYHFDVWNSTDGKQWNFVNKGKPVPWGPRCLHYTVVHKDKIWVLGGQTVPQFAAAPENFCRDVWTSSDGVQWTKITPQEPYWSMRGMIGGSTVFKDRIWILGGGTYDTPKRNFRDFFNDVWSSADGEQWQRHVASCPWEPRQYHDVAVYDDRMWVLEGYGGAKTKGNRNDVWYSADGVNWYEVENTPWAPRHAASVYVHDGALWMVAGNNMESDVWKLRRK